MGNQTSELKVFVDEKKKKVMFAEAQEDFVEILLSFFTLPLGKIATLSRKLARSQDMKVGSLSSLYESVEDLHPGYFSEASHKDNLINPINSSAQFCSKLKINLDKMLDINSQRDRVFLKKKANFIITDDLKVVPVVLDTSIALFNSLGVEKIELLDARTMYFGLEEFSNLLKWSLLTNNPLTKMVLGESKPCASWLTNSKLSNRDFISSNSGKTQTVKLLVQKSKKKVICAHVGNRFVELLFSFLIIPLGTLVRLTKDDSSPVGITNLYDSISSLGDGKILKSEDVKNLLLCPKISATYRYVTDLLPIYEANTRPGSLLKEQARFIVTDDLQVTASKSTATISNFNVPGIPVGDMEFVELRVGEQEALLLLKASLTSTSALTDCLKAVRKKQKDHVPSIALTGDGGRDWEEVDFTLEEENDFDALFVKVD